jgi:hypothetical protein
MIWQCLPLKLGNRSFYCSIATDGIDTKVVFLFGRALNGVLRYKIDRSDLFGAKRPRTVPSVSIMLGGDGRSTGLQLTKVYFHSGNLDLHEENEAEPKTAECTELARKINRVFDTLLI